jgi:spoIIIJ-associated protein
MNQRTTLEVIAPTVEEALAQGLAQLGLPAQAVSVEVLDAGTTGLFGLGGRQVRVRLMVNPPGGPPPYVPPPAVETKEPARRLARTPKPPRNAAPAEALRIELEAAPAQAPATAKERPAASLMMAEGHDQTLDTAEAVASKLVHLMGLQAQVSAHYDESSDDDRQHIHVDIRGEDLSALIGRHAETLNAFQYVAGLIVGKERQQWAHLVVDVEGFRSRREQQLRQLATRMAEQVIKTGRRASLEPMTAGERRIVHLELRGHPAVTTESIGEDPHRKVTIIPKDA